MNILCLVILVAFGVLSLKAQPIALTNEEEKRVHLLRSFGEYVQRTPWEQLEEGQLQRFVKLSDSARVEGSRAWKFYKGALQEMDRLLDGVNLAEYDAVPWNRFPSQDKLPKMVWEAEPLTHVMGRPLQTGDREAELAQGRRTLGNTLVVFKKSEPDQPLYYVLFDDQTGKIASWLLINQGGLHYFWLL